MLDSNTSITALIVDDSPDSLGMLNTALNSQGITALVALSGQQALNISRQVTPDVVLLDAVMPEMDGFDTCLELKKRFPQLPIIFMTGLSDTDDIVRGLEAGAVDYVTKPINTNEVIARLKVHVHNASNLISVKAALESADQSIISIDDMGNVLWATRRAQEELNKYQHKPAQLSNDLAEKLTEYWRESPEKLLYLSGFSDGSEESVSASYLNKLGAQHLIKLQGTSETRDVKTLLSKLPITKREAEVLLWLSKGKSNWDIATILAIKPRTINKHLELIFKKLSVDNRTAAAGIALDTIAASK